MWFQSPVLVAVSLLGHASCRTRTRWITLTRHFHATGCALFLPVSVCVMSFCHVELQFFTGASPTHEFSSILAFVVGLLLPNEHIHAHYVAMTELHVMLY